MVEAFVLAFLHFQLSFLLGIEEIDSRIEVTSEYNNVMGIQTK